MELDLNSFLDSASSSDNDDINNRTVDDILNDHDDPVSPDSHSHSTPPGPGPGPTRSPDPFSLFRRGVSRPLPPLFSGVRSNVKPGVALAVAAAASRSVLTPHAAAIKSRRAAKKVEDELGSTGFDVGCQNLGGELRGSLVDRTSSASEVELDVSNQEEEVCRVANYGNYSDILLEEVVNLDENNGDSLGGLSDFRRKDIESESGSDQVGVSSVVEAYAKSSDSNVDEEDRVSDSPKSGEDRTDDEGAGAVAFVEQELDTGVDPTEENELGSHGEDAGSLSDIDELVEEVIGELESELLGERNYDTSQSSKKPLELAEELEKKQAFTGLHWEEGAAAQPMRLEGIRRGSVALGYFDIDADNTITRKISSTEFRRDYGSPQALAVNLSYIAVGMSKGYIVAVPSKYSLHTVDNMDAKMILLGDRSHAPVTSICFSQQGDLLLAGYSDGRVVLWDVQRASTAKVINGEHTAPVIHTLILGQDTQTARSFRAITGDGKGVVLLHTFSVFKLVNAFSVETKCLTDGQRTGMGLAASAVLCDEISTASSLSSPGNATVPSGGIGSMVGGVVGPDAGWKLFNKSSSLVEEDVVVIVTHQSAVVLKLHPKMEGCGQLPKPDGIREGSIPYTAWKSVSHSRSSSADPPTEAMERVSWLAIAWDRKLQVAKLVKSELKEHAKWSLESSAIGVAWLDDQMLVVLTSTGQLSLFAKDGNLIHQTSFAVYGGVDDIITYHTHFVTSFGNPEKAYHNCVSIRGASIYILGPTHLVVSRLLPWKERIQVLRKAGDWMGALNMAMTLYDGQAQGVIDLPRTLEAVQNALMPYLVELLLSYVDEVFSYISVACHNQYEKMQQANDVNSRNNHVNSEIKKQFTRVGGVAVEFCAHIKRTDILFDEIFTKFVRVQQKDTFLELLEPYILKDMLGSLPPEIMQTLVEHYSLKGWLQRVEQCVLHMDISSLDFNQVVRLCQEHGLYGALVYLFNKGLDDFRTPLEELLRVLKNSGKETAINLGFTDLPILKHSVVKLSTLCVLEKLSIRDICGLSPCLWFSIDNFTSVIESWPFQSSWEKLSDEEIWYRILVYLKYCFLGLAFPPGHGALTPSRVPSLRTELVQFLLETSDLQTSEADLNLSFKGAFLNLYHLLEIDIEATLDVLRFAFPEDAVMSNDEISSQVTACEMIDTDMNGVIKANSQNYLVQDTVNALVDITGKGIYNIDTPTGAVDMGEVKSWPAKKDICHLFEFIAYFVTGRRAKVSKDVLCVIVEYLTSEDTLPPSISTNGAEASRRKEKQLLALLKAVPDTDWSPPYVLQLCEKAQFYQISGFIHTLRHRYVDALDSYMNYTDEPIHAFAFINLMLQQLNEAESSAFRSAVISRIPKLIQLSRECSFFLVLDHFKEEESYIIQELRPHSESLFLYLKTIVEAYLSGALNFSNLTKDDVHNSKKKKDDSNVLEVYMERISDFPKFLRNNPVDLTDEMIELYLELLCQYERPSVLKFLETFDNYRVENCLRICQEYGIIDGAAFLLERVGDVGSALLLTLSCLNDKFIALDSAVGNIISSSCLSSPRDCWSTISETKERNDIFNILHACIRLCQRNTPRLNSGESEVLWFKLLDSFCEPMMGSSDNRLMSERSNDVQRQATSIGPIEVEVACTINWKITKSNKGANVLRKLLSEFIKDIVEGMIGYVPLPTIMSKLLSNGSHEFGDFKSTILGMLGTYGFERRIMDTAKSLIDDDTFYTMSILKKEASHGYAPRSLTCCICSCPLTKNSSSASIRVFSCGHATHIQCESLENDNSSRGFSSGCPVCMPKKKVQKSRDKSVLPENSLVNYYKSRPQRQQIPVTALPLHDSDSTENSYGLQQISRFEILSNLHKDQKSIEIENMPQLRLAPPAVYHEKVKKGSVLLAGESSKIPKKPEEETKSRRLRDLKVKGSSLRLPLKSSIFGKEKTSKH